MENKSAGINVQLREQLLDTNRKYNMLHPGDNVLVAVSGGPDSVALLHLLYTMTAALGIEIGVGHFNHGLRPQAADAESDFVQSMADDLGLICHRKKVHLDDKASGLEQRARDMRYAFLHRMARDHGYAKIAVAHHAEDNAETVLMHLLRGSGLRGLSGISPRGQNGVVRPLIHCRKADILAYLKDNDLPFCMDASNNDPRFTRNKIRSQLMPLLAREFNPNIVDTLNRTARLLGQEDQWLDQYAAHLLGDLNSHRDVQKFVLPVEKLTGVPPALQARMLRCALRVWRGRIRGLGADHVQTLMAMINSDHLGRRANLPLGIAVQRTATDLVFSTTTDPRRAWAEAPDTDFSYTVASRENIPSRLDVDETGYCLFFSVHGVSRDLPALPKGPRTIALDLDQLDFPLVIRNVQSGDRLRPFGMKGSQKIKQLFIDRKIPVEQRHHIPVLTSGDHVIWVAGLRRGSAAPVTKSTTCVLRIALQSIDSPCSPLE